jgi:hypothetical protein
MTRDQYRAALTDLGLPIQGRLTSELLGVTPRMSAFYAAGRYPVPATIANLVYLLRRARWAGLPPKDAAAYLARQHAWETRLEGAPS